MESIELLRILDTITKAVADLKSDIREHKVLTRLNRSDQTNELFAALAKAQSEMPIASKSKENPFFKSTYADEADLVEASRPCLSKNGLAVVYELVHNDNGQTICYGILTHSSGQFMESHMRVLPSKTDIQSISSYLTSVKRNLYKALTGIVAADEDDDGEIATMPHREMSHKGTALNLNYNPSENKYETITKEQLELLESELDEFPDIAENILNGLKLNSIADMPKSKFALSLKRVREIKQVRNGK